MVAQLNFSGKTADKESSLSTECAAGKTAFEPVTITVIQTANDDPTPPGEVRRGCMLWLISMFTSLMVVLLLTRLVLFTVDQGSTWDIEDDSVSVNRGNFSIPDLVIVPNHVWSPEYQELRRLNQPPRYVGVSDSCARTCNSTIECNTVLKELQHHHENDFHEQLIGWNFLIDGNGVVYEGRGWDLYAFFTGAMREKFLGVCLIGSYDESGPQPDQFIALQELVKRGMRLGKLQNDYKLAALGWLRDVQKPSKVLEKVARSWPRGCWNDCWTKNYNQSF